MKEAQSSHSHRTFPESPSPMETDFMEKPAFIFYGSTDWVLFAISKSMLNYVQLSQLDSLRVVRYFAEVQVFFLLFEP